MYALPFAQPSQHAQAGSATETSRVTRALHALGHTPARGMS